MEINVIPINPIVEWSRALDCFTFRSTRVQIQTLLAIIRFLFFNLIYKVLIILNIHECFACPEGCDGVFKNKNCLNSTQMLFHLYVVIIDEINIALRVCNFIS